ncbi:hypothetical protein [Bacillus sp. OK048]|uniref:hypothetical protein n=1 Tax=Bacillus sp. OK048 TaxID=1882761 RepID=UPI00088855A4|nr:hypothetical protein [Bacillus sp. OK048]SDM42089.1 hypothetical protein SAMN05443253_103251 [Bacillus sp. OK048]
MNLSDIEKEYATILHSSDEQKDVKLAGLMTKLEREFSIPMLKDEQWERNNKAVIAMYRKISISRDL